MTMSFSNRIAQRLQEKDVEQLVTEQPQAISDDADIVETTDFYGAVRIGNGLMNIELYLADGNRAAVPCSFMTRFRFNRSEITFRADGEKYTISGRNLEPLWIRLINQRLKYVKANIGNDLSAEKDLFVKDIVISEL